MKKAAAVLLTICMLFTAAPVFAGQTGSTIFVKPSDFSGHLGTWSLIPTDAGSFGEILRAPGESKPAEAQSASVTIEIPEDGEYFIWVRSRDFKGGTNADGTTVSTGNRQYQLAVGAALLEEVFGDHGENGWKWEAGGSLKLTKGETALQLVDTVNFMGRMEGIVLSTDKNFALPETAEAMKAAIASYPAQIVTGAPVPDNPVISAAPSTVPPAVDKATVTFQPDKHYTILTADSFKDHMGIWTTTPDNRGGFLPEILFGSSSGLDSSKSPAVAKAGIPVEGIYKIMVHTRDFDTMTATRLFKVQLGDREPVVHGDLGTNGWGWQEEAPAPFFKGEYDLSLLDFKGNNARLDMIILTDDLAFQVEDSAANFDLLASKCYVPGSVDLTEAPDPNRPDSDIAVKLNGSYLSFDVEPVLINDRTMVPFRAIFEALGCGVSWDDDTQTATGTRNGKTVKLTIQSDVAKVDGKGTPLDSPPVLVNDRTLIPLRFVSEAMGASVQWNEDTQTVNILAVLPSPVYLFTAKSFQELGTWILEANTEGAFNRTNLKGIIPDAGVGTTIDDADASKTKPAIATFQVARAGTYRLWVHSNDYETNQQGTRFFNVGFNGTMLPQKFGTHGQTGYRWADGGTITLEAGENTLELYDTSGFFARLDAVMLSEDLVYQPPESYEGVLSVASPLDPAGEIDLSFPLYALEQGAVTDTVALVNDDTKVVFYTVETSRGPVIQNEIYSMYDGQWVKTKNRTEALGYLVLRADESGPSTTTKDMFSFNSSYQINGAASSYVGIDVYKSGLPNWMIPTGVARVGDNQVLLTFTSGLADFQALWELDERGKAPKVTVDAKFNQEGYYSIGAWEGTEVMEDQYVFALAPYRVQSKRVYEDPVLLTEQFLFTPMGTYTLPQDNAYIQGAHVTKGVVVEGSWIPLRWVYSDNCLFGINMKGPSHNFRGSVFAPVMGSEESHMQAGDSYNLQYRVISTVADWYDTYQYIATDLFDVHDYRENVYSTLNDAIFNARRVMMDDEYGGWDVISKAHYNMEGKNQTSVGNPMEAMQIYLLTEDEEVLTRRAIPTLANFLTRGTLHFNRNAEGGGGSYWETSGYPNPIGTPIDAFNANVVGGMYEMTRGMVPYLYEVAQEKGKSNVSNSYNSVAGFSNALSLYQYTGDTQYLDLAKQQADEYIENVVYNPQTDIKDWSLFTLISYFPNVASLVDLYEIAGEQRYLDAAEFAARWLSTCLWVPGLDGDKINAAVEVNNLDEIHKLNTAATQTGFFWHGDKQWRIGAPVGDPANTENDPIIEAQHGMVPAWIPSRVGIGNEQSSTFGNSNNIIMSAWVGDLLKLSQYTGDAYFATEARNAIVGHFAGYSGYGQNGFITYQQKPEYAWEGPDYNGLYWHHLPPFLAMLEDFLINMTTTWSEGKISFPSLRQQGYAYFNSNQYGFAPGQFFDQDSMWLWMDEDMVDTGNLQIDWLAARKDGMFGLALLNESAEEQTAQVSLLEQIPGGSSYSGPAFVHDPDGTKTQMTVTEGKFSVQIPAKSLRAVTIALPRVTAPAYSKINYVLDGKVDLKNTVTNHTNGKGLALQMSPDCYYAYVYVTDKPETASKLTMTYQIGNGQKQTVSADIYPYEFLIKVDDVNTSFLYTLEETLSSGGTKPMGGGTLKSALDPNPGGSAQWPETFGGAIHSSASRRGYLLFAVYSFPGGPDQYRRGR